MNLREELQAIRDKYGKLTPQIVVEEVRDPDHPLHSKVFDRAPDEAAEAWYLSQAHELITSVRVTYKRANGSQASIRAFHAVRQDTPENGGFVYEPTEAVLSDPFMTKLVLADMKREWKSLHNRYKDFSEFIEMVREDVA